MPQSGPVHGVANNRLLVHGAGPGAVLVLLSAAGCLPEPDSVAAQTAAPQARDAAASDDISDDTPEAGLLGDASPACVLTPQYGGCPAEPPVAGAACAADPYALYCTYPLDESTVVASACRGDHWQPRETLSCLQVCLDAIPRQARLAFDGPACAQRPIVPCLAGEDTQAQLSDTFKAMVSRCGSPGSEVFLGIRFENGCAVELGSSQRLRDEPFERCMREQLEPNRLACGEAVQCTSMEISTLATN